MKESTLAIIGLTCVTLGVIGLVSPKEPKTEDKPKVEYVVTSEKPKAPEVVEPEEVEVVEVTHWGESQVRVTAYCACHKCCGKWAEGRPYDPVTGKPIVTGASGNVLETGVSVAAPSSLPFGTKLLIDGKEYVVEDRPAQWAVDSFGGYLIDVYFDTHGDRLERDYYDVYIINE